MVGRSGQKAHQELGPLFISLSKTDLGEIEIRRSSMKNKAIFIVSLLFSIGALILDFASPEGYTEWVFYLVPILTIVFVTDLRLIFSVAGINTFLLIIGYFFSEDPHSAIVVFHRVLGIGMIWILYLNIVYRSRAQSQILDSEQKLFDVNEELSRSNALLSIEQQRWKHVVQGIADEVWVCDSAGKMGLVNLPEVTHMGFKEFTDKTIEQIAEITEIYNSDGSVRPFEQSPLLRALKGETVRGEEIVRLKEDGNSHWRNYSAAPIRDEKGIIIGSVAVIRDITNQKLTEQELRDSQHDLNRAQAVAHIGSWRLNVQSNKLQWSEETYRIFGIPEGTPVTYETFRSRIHLDDREFVDKKWKAALRKEPYEIEHRIVVDDQSIKWVMEKAELEFDQHGELSGGFGTVQDITDLKLAETALKNSESRLRKFYDSGMIGIFYFNLDGAITDANDRFLEMIDYTREDLQKGLIKWTEITPSEYKAKDEYAITELTNQGVETPYEKEYICKNSSHISVIIGAAKFDEKHHEGIAFVVDITERKKAEKALIKSERRLAESQRLAHIGSWEMNIQTEEMLWSDEMFAICGLDINTYTPSIASFIELVYPEDRTLYRKAINEITSIGKSLNIDFRIIRTDGEIRFVNTMGNVEEFDSNGKPLFIRGTKQDITERKSAEETVRQSELKLKLLNENLEETVVNRTVQVRTLSRALALAEQRERKRFSQLLHENLQQILFALKMQITYSFSEHEQPIKDDIDEAKRLVDKGLGTAKNLALELNPPVLYGEGLRDSLSWLATHFKNNYGLNVNQSIGPVPEILEDVQIMIVQMVRELLSNVIKHSGVTIADLSVEAKGQDLYITVRDNGTGFDISSVKKAQARVGYGLFGIDERLRLFGGKLDIISSPGNGTTATLMIPLKIF
jgi:PAS domain S-box-containing protein